MRIMGWAPDGLIQPGARARPPVDTDPTKTGPERRTSQSKCKAAARVAASKRREAILRKLKASHI